jgi:hypothetical protein
MLRALLEEDPQQRLIHVRRRHVGLRVECGLKLGREARSLRDVQPWVVWSSELELEAYAIDAGMNGCGGVCDQRGVSDTLFSESIGCQRTCATRLQQPTRKPRVNS